MYSVAKIAVAISLADYGRGENYVARQVERWSKQYRASETQSIEDMERLIAWLADKVPADTLATIRRASIALNSRVAALRGSSSSNIVANRRRSSIPRNDDT